MRAGFLLGLSSLALLTASLSACAGTDRELPVFELAPPPALPVPDVSQPIGGARPTDGFVTASTSGDFSPAEIRYIESTAGAVFRRRASERATSFVAAPGGGYGVCLRSPARSGGHDLAMIVLQRRLDGSAISQVDDDSIVLRRPRDTAPCAAASLRFVAARRA